MVDSQNKKRKPIPASLSEYAEWRSPHIEGHAGIVMTVEGILPDATIDTLLEDMCRKLCRIEGKLCKSQEIRG